MKGGVFGNRTYKGTVTGVTFIGDSEEILAVSGDGTVRLHRQASDHEIMTFAGSTGYQHAAAATPDGKAVIATDSAGNLHSLVRSWTAGQTLVVSGVVFRSGGSRWPIELRFPAG